MRQLLIDAMRAGVRFRIEGDELHVSAPQGALSDEMRSRLRGSKSEILELIRSEARARNATDQLPPLIKDLPNREQPFPLTDVQHAYWLGRQGLFEFGNVATHFYFELDCGVLDCERLNEALCRLIARHEMLRAVVGRDGLQRILPEVPRYQIKTTDLGESSGHDAEAAIMAAREAMSHAVPPADQWPLFEARVTRFAGGKVRLHVSIDMLILDAWSMFVLFREWHALYQDPAARLPEIAVSYRDYVLAERTLIGGAAYQRAKQYWLDRIDALPAAPELPLRAQDVDSRTAPRFTRRRARLDKAQWAKLRGRAAAESLTPSGVLMAAYGEVLTRWSSSHHFTINLTLFNRLPLHPHVNRLVGDFTSLTMLEVDGRDPAPDFCQRARRLQRQLMDDLEHREFSGVEVLREWTQRRGGGLHAAMPVVFTSALVLGGDGEDARVVESFGPMVYGLSQTPQVWLDNQVMEIDGDLVFNWDAVEDVFEAGVLDAMFDAYRALLVRLAEDDGYWSRSEVIELPPAVLSRRTATDTPGRLVENRTLLSGLLEYAASTPDAIALLTPGRTLTYRQLLAESAAVARRLHADGLRKGELVAVVMHKGWEQIVGALGAILAGGAYMPVDAHLPVQRQRDLLQLGEVRYVLAQPNASRNAQLAEYSVLEIAVAGQAAAAWPELPGVAVQPDDLAYVIFTSGTTGVPKGVMIDHRGAINTIVNVNEIFQVGPNDSVLGVSSLSFDLSVYDIFGALDAGAALVLPDSDHYLDPLHWKNLIAQHGITLWNSAPQLMRMLMDACVEGEIASTRLRAVLLSGDWVPVDLPERLAQHFPAARVTSLGGATEASIWSIYYPVEAVDPEWSSIPYGKALPNQSMWVLDSHFRPCPDHVRGRIYIGGIGLAKGYWNDADKTAQRFVTQPRTGERLYDTGDLGRYSPDGNIVFLGRCDDQVKIRGHRVEPGEIAATLRQHPEIEEAAVLATGGSQQRRELAAYIELVRDQLGELGHIESISEPLSLRRTIGEVLVAPNARTLDEAFARAWAALDDYYLAALLTALSRLGVSGTKGEHISTERLLAAGVARRYTRWLERAMQALVDDGLLRELDEGNCQVARDWESPDLARLSAHVAGELQRTLGFSADEARWFTGAVERLHDVLTETMHSAEIYTAETTAQIYQKLFPDNHAQLARVIDALVASRGGGLNVLEVGAGLGSATQHILPTLAEAGCHYVFTDISDFFLRRAQGLFGTSYGTVDFAQLNLDVRPEFQGFERHGFDLIVASSMLHDVRDVRLALRHLTSMLRPGGNLVLLEETRFFRSFDLHMGLQQGFDVFSDEDLRTSHCLLSSEGWERVLREVGFTDVAVVAAPGTVIDHLGFHVIVATGPHSVVHLHPQPIKAFLGEHLPDYMVPRYVVQMDRMPVSSNGKIDYKALPAIPESIEGAQAAKVAARNEAERRILDAWSQVMGGREIGVTDNFFELGGDSLVATQLVRQINALLPFKLEIHEFLEHLTVESLARLYLSRQSAGGPAVDDNGARPVAEIFPALALDPEAIASDVTALIRNIEALTVAPRSVQETARAVLVTGATGWLGAYLVAELLTRSTADVYCLVRARTAQEGATRIVRNLQNYGIALDAQQLSRVKAVPGDLEESSLGLAADVWARLCEQIDVIYHFAASINTLGDYAQLHAANVGSAAELVRLASIHHAKRLVFGSSMAVCLRATDDGFTILPDEQVSDSPAGLVIGYAQSKWAAERIFLSASGAGVPVRVFRIPHVLPAIGALQHENEYLFSSLLGAARKTHCVPDWSESHLDGIPVDRLSRLIVEHTLGVAGEFDKIVHVSSYGAPNLRSLVQLMLEEAGVQDIRVVDREDWKRQCREAANGMEGEAGLLAQRLFALTSAGSLVDAMFGAQRADTGYFDQQGRAAVTDLTSADYWRAYFCARAWG